jgi:DUF1365 family protein
MNAPAKIIRGQVMHERVRPVLHRFVYPVFYMRFDLARLEEMNSAWFGINRRRFASLYTRDYGARDGSDLRQWMTRLLNQHGIEATGEIWLQTFPRVFGFVFNPVSFWYCYDQSGALRAVMAEVNNTFGESHRYLLSDTGAITAQSELISEKNMHVSPFCRVQGLYRFRFRDTGSTTFVSLDYHDENGLLIKTTVGGTSAEYSAAGIRDAVFKQPFLTFGIVVGIHWQAFKLWRKKVPFFSKPAMPLEYLSRTKDQRTNQEESIP